MQLNIVTLEWIMKKKSKKVSKKVSKKKKLVDSTRRTIDKLKKALDEAVKLSSKLHMEYGNALFAQSRLVGNRRKSNA